MPLYNNCQFMGNLGADPELQYTASGTAVTNLSIAVDRREKVNDEWVNETTWIRLTAFAQTAESIAQHLAKGDKILVSTEYQKRKYQDEEGKDRYSHDFIIRDWRIASRISRAETESFVDDTEDEEEEESLPF